MESVYDKHVECRETSSEHPPAPEAPHSIPPSSPTSRILSLEQKVATLERNLEERIAELEHAIEERIMALERAMDQRIAALERVHSEEM